MERNEALTKFLEESLPLFRKWREINIIFDQRPEQDIKEYLSATSRDALNVLFVLFRGFDSDDGDSQTDFDLARYHLNSLVYETFALLQASFLTEISNNIEIYKLETIHMVIPKYFEEYAKRTSLIRENIKKLNDNRKSLKLYEQKQDKYTSLDDMYADVIFLEEVVTHFRLLEDNLKKKVESDSKNIVTQDSKTKNAFNKQTWITIIVSLITAVVGAVVGSIVTAKLTPSQPTNSSQSINSLSRKETLKQTKSNADNAIELDSLKH